MSRLLRGNQLQIAITTFMLFYPLSSNSIIRNGLSGAYFRVSAHHFPPYQLLIYGANGTFRYVGSTPNIIYWMAEKFNFTYDLFPVNNTEIAKLGTVLAGLNQIINKEVDISTLCFLPTLERTQYMEFSYPVAIESYKFMVPKPDEESRLWGPIRPFQYSVWGCILLSIVFVLAAFSYLSWCYSHWPNLPNNEFYGAKKNMFTIFGSYAMYIASVCTNQGIHC
ncbi:glutamate receptor ionotropic, delta-1-like [Daphnia pulex]|uniref:glutamate receptor ionotropic, delta-1-like n=1 Tax=Daphnia pulex TaxID=6669 RepID=UPI001EDDB719|nr:glutamate receptor ionotropic, delta-1-like [Daphnia pulex]